VIPRTQKRETETTVIAPDRIRSHRVHWRLGGAILLAAATSIGIAACGGGSDSGGGGSTTSAAAGGGAQTVSVGETEYQLDPSDPSVKAGTVTFDVSNDGKVTHSLEVEGPNGNQSLAQDLNPGDSGKLTVDLGKPGKYTFFCPIDNHRGMGMEGTITVGSGAAAGGGAATTPSGGGGGASSSGGGASSGGGGYGY
jgi:uncharacterized cupredoxin-like copper-binding protein